MKVQKVCGGLFIVLGVLSLFTATQQQVQAVTCNASAPQEYSICNPAEAEDIHRYSGPIGTCIQSYYFWCDPVPGSNCGSVSGYAIAVPGRCESSDSNASPVPVCIDEYGVTVLEIKWYETYCGFLNGTCGCLYFIGGTYHPNQYVQVCNCANG